MSRRLTCTIHVMTILFRRLLLTFILAALPPVYGRAGAFEDLYRGGVSGLLPAPSAAVKAFFKNVEKDSIAAHTYLKAAYQRERPFMRDTRVKPCLPRAEAAAALAGTALGAGSSQAALRAA